MLRLCRFKFHINLNMNIKPQNTNTSLICRLPLKGSAAVNTVPSSCPSPARWAGCSSPGGWWTWASPVRWPALTGPQSASPQPARWWSGASLGGGWTRQQQAVHTHTHGKVSHFIRQNLCGFYSLIHKTFRWCKNFIWLPYWRSTALWHHNLSVM